MESYCVLIDGNLYPLLLGSLYVQNFSEYLKGNTLDFTSVTDPKLLAQLFNRLAYHVAMSLCAMEDEFGPDELIDEKKAIRRQINTLDYRYDYMLKKSDYHGAYKVNRDFIVRAGNYVIELQNGNYTLRDDYDELSRG